MRVMERNGGVLMGFVWMVGKLRDVKEGSLVFNNLTGEEIKRGDPARGEARDGKGLRLTSQNIGREGGRRRRRRLDVVEFSLMRDFPGK